MLKILLNRRSVRKYKEKQVESEKVKQILGGGMVAPSGKNKKPWEFITIEDKKILEELSKVKPTGGKFLDSVPLGIAIVGREDISDTWVEDCSIASTFMQLEAENQGLKSCWVQLKSRFTEDGKDAEGVAKEILGVSNNKRLLCVIAIGYPDENKEPYREEDYVV